MSEVKSIEKELEKFGLSTNQAKIYLLLVAHKEMRIQEIVTLAGIPRSSVYANLRVLYELGIAEEIVEESYKKVRPYSIGAIKHGLDEKMLHLQKLRNDIDDLERSIDLTPVSGENKATDLRYYKGRSGARQIFWNSLKTDDTVYVYSDWGRGRYVGMKFYETFVYESRRRNFKERVLINPTVYALETIKMYNVPGSPIMRSRVQDIRALDEDDMVIKGDSLIYDDVYAQVYLKQVEIHGFEIENSNFAAAQRSIYEILWERATPIIELL